MKAEIYENIIKNSKISYLKIDLNKDKNDKYISINIIDYSKEFEKLMQFITNNSILDKDISKLIINNWISENFKDDEFDLFIKDIIHNGQSRIEYNIKSKEEKMIVDIYYLETYFILVYNIENNLSFQKDIEQNEENFREITKYCQSAFIIRDKYKATYVSPGFNNIFESEADELYEDINLLKSYFIDEEFHKNFISYDFDYSECNEGVGKVRLQSNQEKWVWYKFLPIKDLKGNVIKRIGTLTDISERKKLEEEKNKLKLDFFANLSHEIRTPINLISSTIQLMKMNLNKIPLTELDSFNRYVEILDNNTFRLLKLINNLLDSTKVDSGFVKFNPINADIVEFIEDICTSVVEFAEFNDMNLIFDTNTEVANVCFDSDIIERTLLNLLSNAVKFNKQSGTIYVSLYIDDKEIKISVRDEGIGISKDNIDKIFKRFEQANIRGRIEKQGSGIGLYLVKSLIELHGGSISVNSIENEGSEFIVIIPKKVSDTAGHTYIVNDETRSKKSNIEFSDI